MMMNLLYGVPTMALCLLLQSLVLAAVIRYYRRRQDQISDPSFFWTVAVINGVMLLLVAGNLAQLTIWAVLFWLLDEFDVLADAIYHSAVNFATLGYGDIVMTDEHRFLGPLEAINGVLMIGVSTSVLLMVYQDAIRKRVQARRH